ncbi:unnamed protein product [Rotaria sordida]|uniref:Uncharacterized protein n=1 Tax=Rotaria sordida TaxID=392033 RepID=A0A815D3T8_9BILA|nr:unnamed protein product [Rotaria sordida]
MGDTNGQVVAGSNGYGSRLDQLYRPTDVLIDKETDSLIICDRKNRRVVRWSRRSGTTQGEILIDNIVCWGLAIDDQRYLYISDIEKDGVRRYQIGDKNGTLVAGGNREGDGLNQLDFPTYIFVDQQQTIYVSDYNNHRVMKWNKDAKEGIVVAGVIPNIPVDARWVQNATTIAGGHGSGSATNQLDWPYGLFVDDDQTIVIADYVNHRIIQWKKGDTDGQVVAGGNGEGNRLDQLNIPTDVLIDKETDSLIICDWLNQRVVRWSRRSGTTQGEILIDNIWCYGLAMDDQRYLYISDTDKHEVRRYQIGDKNGTIVAGGNGEGAGFNQLNVPRYIFVDQQQTVYVSDNFNHRVMKWNKGAKEGIVVAGGQGYGNALTQLSNPYGLFVDTLGTIYVADCGNHRVMRWPKGAKEGTVIVGGNGKGAGANQFNYLRGLSFDRHGNLYVVDNENNRVQRFSIE